MVSANYYISPKKYRIIWFLATVLPIIIFSLVIILFYFFADPNPYVKFIDRIAPLIVLFAFYIPFYLTIIIGASVRRLRDAGQEMLCIILFFIPPFIGYVILQCILFSVPSANRNQVK